ncbi:unconventional myosin-XIX isoform X1 [Colletes latitarsis]|uniref:unconventional myosin-XIX isoform X1 n=1 Tax=Colletes latitarsis TaxID=2605962 RepID=UPI004035008C
MAAAIEPTTMFEWDLINDLGALPENESIIIDFLLERLQRGQIYTWVGPLLLTLNPNNEVSTSRLYDFSEFDEQINTYDTINEASAHIFTVAAKAHYSLTRELGRHCQVIIISGETETGKTFNAFKCLEFLSRINKNSAPFYEGDYAYDIMQRITDACRLISAFTTACTERNDVSSRHVQLVRLHYKAGNISGATINSFLLERSRVTKGSSNFQIFYQMIFGMSNAELDTFNLSEYENYDILSAIDYSKRKYFQECFQDTLKALEVLGFKKEKKEHLFQVLALLIHMGNIRFVENGETCTIDLINEESEKALKNTCDLTSLTKEVVIELFTTILINPKSVWRKHTVYHRYLTTVDACRMRLHSIIRHLYDLLFHWILNCVNDALSTKHEYLEWLGILDVFGFESFNQNGIEQLCVNYANERMQQYFIKTYLENSRKDLQNEGFIEISRPIHTIRLYKERLTVLEEGLFMTLNDACQSPIPINTHTVTQLVCQKSRNKFLREKEGHFIIEHYSDSVAYSVKDLLVKNTDKVPSEISVIFQESKNTFLASLIDIEEDKHSQIIKTSTKKKTMLAKLKYNIDTLIKDLSKCDSHYVRCVKPSRLSNHEWDKKNFRKQLACIGIFDALPLAKCKYPIRLQYKEFCQRYSKRPTEVTDVNKCQLILESVMRKKDLHASVHYGKQLIFLTEPVFSKLELYRRNYRIKCANKIKIFWRRYSKVQSRHATSLEIMLERKSEKSCNNEESDDVFIIDSISLKNDSLTDAICVIESEKKINHEDRFEDVHVGNCLIDNVTKSIKQIDPDNFSKCKDSIDYCKRKNNVNVNCADDNNNSMMQHSGDTASNKFSINITLAVNNEKQARSIYNDTEKNVCIVQLNSRIFFYKNGILSCRRLPMASIRIHTRATCLSNSHILPRYELPQGLQDCL